MKSFIDKNFPSFSRNYRQFRDNYKFKRLKPYSTIYGFDLYGDSDLDTSREESFESSTFKEYFQKVDMFLDVGANVGLFSCLAAKYDLDILSFEPHPNNLQCLYRNIKMNEIRRIEVFPIAISNEPGIMEFFGGGQGATLVKGWAGIESNYQTLVPVNTLDNLAYERCRSKTLLIKVDIEGNEYPMLSGATNLLNMDPSPTWILEHCLTENFGGDVNPYFKQVFEVFWNAGYKAYVIEDPLREVKISDVERWIENKKRDFGYVNYLFSKEAL
ncbi:MAG: FkbM family methyltransferase [Cyanothece sp. SIO1E1]|nr:FkbM family methyltransferase [Cyanothece sp. SIO1E1]